MATFYALNFENGKLPADDVSGLNQPAATPFGTTSFVPGPSGGVALNAVAGGVRVSGTVLAASIDIGFGIRVHLNSNTTGYRTAVAHANSGGTDYIFALYASDSSGYVRARVGGVDLPTATSIRDGFAHHLALSYEGSTGHTEIYVDGVKVADGTTAAGAVFGGSQPITFGHSAIEARDLNGIIDDFMIQQEPCFPGDAILMAGEQVYERNVAAFGFDEVSGTTARDSHIRLSSRRKNLTLTSAGSFGDTFRAKRGGALVNTIEGQHAAEWIGSDFGDWDRLGFQVWAKCPAVSADRALVRLSNPDGTVRWEGGVGASNTLYLKYRPDGSSTTYTRRTAAGAYTPGTPFAWYLGNTPVGDYWFTSSDGVTFATPLAPAGSGWAPSVPAYGGPADLGYLISGVGRMEVCEVGQIDDLRIIANHWQAKWLAFAQDQVPSAGPIGTPRAIGFPSSAGDRGVWSSSAAQDLANPQTAVIPRPANLADGDLLIAAMSYRDVWSSTSAMPTAPAGWTRIVFPQSVGEGTPPNQVADTVRGATQFYWKRVTDAGSEPATYNFTWPITFRAAAVIGRFTGVDPELPINASSTWLTNGSPGTVGLTAEADGSAVLILHSADNATPGSATGYTQSATSTAGSNTPSVAILARLQDEAGPAARVPVSPSGSFGMIALTPQATSSLYIGDQPVVAMYLGDQPVSAVYLGDTLLYRAVS